MTRIPFNRPSVEGRELEYVEQAIRNGHVSGDGPYTRKASAMLQSILGAPRVLLTTSCTHALEMAALLLDLEPGDEVIVPAFTFVSGANAFALRGATPVFADIRPDTLNLDASRLEDLVTPRTRAIAPVHYAGVGCEMDAILEIAGRRKVPVIEDNAHGLFGRVNGRNLGTFGAMATQSFHETKNVSCGEGGALVINDPRFIARAEIIREKGTNRSRFFRGEVDRYSWVDLGSSFLPSDILAAFLVGQLEQAEAIQAKRRRIWTSYFEGLGEWAARVGARLPVVPDECDQSYHLFYLLMPDLAARQSLIEALRAEDICAVFHYQPLHVSEMGRRYGGFPGQCAVTEAICDRLVRLPFYNGFTDADQERVIHTILQWRR